MLIASIAFTALLRTPPQGGPRQPNPTQVATEADHQAMMNLRHITSIRRGRDGMTPSSPYYANYDEAKANPFPTLPEALVLKDGKKVSSARTWWRRRRPEIVEDFDREVYGRE